MFSDLLEALTELPDQALDDRIREIALQRRRLDAEFAVAIKVAESRQLGAVDGHRTINSYLPATLNCSSTEASRLRSLARAVDEIDGLPPTSDLFDELVASPESLLDRRCETTSGVTLHAHDVLRAALAGHVPRIVVDAAGVAIDMGRRRRLFAGAAREAAKLLVLRCEHPGCELPADLCDVDHAAEWTDGGEADQHNSRIRCSSHNIDKTRHRWRSRRATNGRTYTIRANGTIMLPIGVRPPTFPSEDDPDGIERLTQLARQRAAALRAA